jgi:hypothetical protein
MRSFLAKYGSEIKGVLSGFDRVRFRGTIRWLASVRGLGSFLGTKRILLKEFKAWAGGLTQRIRQATERLAQERGRPIEYVHSSQVRKEERAAAIAAADGVREGLVCVLTAVEPCHSFTVGPDRQTQRLELRGGPAKCLHQYFYLRHPRMGLMHVRLQTWLPFTVHVCLNGREWLARELRRHGIGFEQRDNCFTHVADVARAQQLLDAQLRVNWSQLLDGLLAEVHPAHPALFGRPSLDYYWSAEETEWATDVMFAAQAGLGRVYPRWLRHALTTFGSGDVLSFLGRCPQVRSYKAAEVTSTLKTRPEGTRVKHQLNRNSVKMYDKQQTVLRVETTVNDPRDLKVLRPKAGAGGPSQTWQRLRKGVADLHRRAEVSQKSNERYLEALATVDAAASLDDIVGPLCRATHWHGRRVRGLRPFAAPDQALLTAIGRGEFTVNGFRNRDLRAHLFGGERVSADETKRRSAKVTRLIRILRAHGLVRKVPKAHRYQLTDRGRLAVTALQAAKNASVDRLTNLAA